MLDHRGVRPFLAAVSLATILGSPALSRADDDVRAVVAFEAGASLAQPSIVGGFEAGLRLNDEWSFLLEVDWNPWISISAPDPVELGALNVGVGVEHIFADGLLRAAVFVGSSTLLFDTALDQAGATGIFLDLVPLSVRVPLVENVVTLRLDPISAHLVAPVLAGLPLVLYQFRHVVSVEVTP